METFLNLKIQERSEKYCPELNIGFQLEFQFPNQKFYPEIRIFTHSYMNASQK